MNRAEVIAYLEEAGFPVQPYRNVDAMMLTTGQVAALLHTTGRTVRNWADSGKLQTIRTLGGRRLFPADGVLHTMAAMFGPVVPELERP